MAATDLIDFHGEVLVELADVLGRDSREPEWRTCVEEALELFERKGDLVAADRARRSSRRRYDGVMPMRAAIARSTGLPAAAPRRASAPAAIERASSRSGMRTASPGRIG